MRPATDVDDACDLALDQVTRRAMEDVEEAGRIIGAMRAALALSGNDAVFTPSLIVLPSASRDRREFDDARTISYTVSSHLARAGRCLLMAYAALSFESFERLLQVADLPPNLAAQAISIYQVLGGASLAGAGEPGTLGGRVDVHG